MIDNSDNEKRCDDNFIYSAVCISKSNKMVFCGVKDDEALYAGCIKVFRNPISGTFTDSVQAHDYRGVSKMCVTHDDHWLITCGADGVICLFEIKDKEARATNKLTEGYTKYSNDILVTRSEIDDIKAKKEGFRSSLQDDNQQSSSLINISNLEDNIQSLQKQLKKNADDFEKEFETEVNKKAYTESTKKDEEEQLRRRCLEELRELEHHFNKEYSNANGKMDM